MIDEKSSSHGTGGSGRRMDALTKERIVAAAIALLDRDGEEALTLRGLAAEFKTGAGALYWHIAGKDDLLDAAADGVVAQALPAARGADPRETIRSLALGVFDAIDAHPWVGAQLMRHPMSQPVLRIVEAIGGCLLAMGVEPPALFNASTTLCGFILGVAGQNAANARVAAPGTDRAAYLLAAAEEWRNRDPAAWPFLGRMAASLAGHDDRAQFLAGIDLILAGIGGAR